MALWVDKYRPHDLFKLDYHQIQAEKLADLVSNGNFPHLMFCGPNGAGKRTRIHCLLKKIYGRGVENVRVEEHQFQTQSGKKLQINVLNSNYHIELTPSDVGIYDRVVVQEIIKGMAEVQQLIKTTQKTYKIVVLLEAENLTKEAQHSLRRTMEKYAATCKIILCCGSSSRIIEPLRSRCMIIRVPAPKKFQVLNVLNIVANKERIDASEDWLISLAKNANGNMRRALCLFEGSVAQYGTCLTNQPVIIPEWESYLKETAKIILQSPNENGIMEVRNRFYELLCRCIPACVIFKGLVKELAKQCPPLLQPIVEAAAKFEHSSNLGSKDIYHLEAFASTVMEDLLKQRKEKK